MQKLILNIPAEARGRKLLVAVSGGVDSMVLCERCREEGFEIGIAHCNFNLRGEESDADEKFVRAYAAKYHIPYFTTSFYTSAFAAENKFSTQVAARKLRYKWFEELLQAEGYDHLLTAHHADDNVETILMNFCKGTGIRGLRGIPQFPGKIIRPFLKTPRSVIEDFAQEHNLAYREDSSNAATKYTRNYFRKEIIPAIEKIYPEFKQNVQDSIERMAGVEILYLAHLQTLRKKLIERRGEEFFVPVLKLQKMPGLSTIIHEIFADFGFSPQQAGEVENILSSDSGRYVDSKTHRVLKDRQWLIISPLRLTEPVIQMIEKDSQRISFTNGELIFKHFIEPAPISSSPDEVQLDAAQIVYPLYLRKWKAGDYFYPLGMPKKKKISRFLTDLKLPLTAKEKVYVLESAKKIIWVVGLRIDDRYKMRPFTKQALKISFRKN